MDCAGAVDTFVAGVNDAGKLVGWTVDAQGVTRGFSQWKDSACVPIEFPSATATLAFAINDPGQITGVYFDQGGVQHAFLFEKGRFVTIDYPDPNVCECWALGINNRGQAVGFFDLWDDPGRTSCDGPDFAYVREPGGTFAYMTPNEAFVDSFQANGINARGQIVGSYLDTTENREYGFLWDNDGTYAYPIEPASAFDTMPTAINAQGQMVGRYFDEPWLGAVGPCHGFFRDVDGTMVELTYPGARYTCVSGLNAPGDISGYWSADGERWHGFVAVKEALTP